MDLTALIERLEKATGPDRDLDIDIADALLDATTHLHYYYWKGLLPRGANPPARDFWKRSAGKYTASLDAALALVEEKLPGSFVQSWNRIYDLCDNINGPGCCLWHDSLNGTKWCEGDVHNAATQPLAVVLALLRALQSQQENSEVKDAG